MLACTGETRRCRRRSLSHPRSGSPAMCDTCHSLAEHTCVWQLPQHMGDIHIPNPLLCKTPTTVLLGKEGTSPLLQNSSNVKNSLEGDEAAMKETIHQMEEKLCCLQAEKETVSLAFAEAKDELLRQVSTTEQLKKYLASQEELVNTAKESEAEIQARNRELFSEAADMGQEMGDLKTKLLEWEMAWSRVETDVGAKLVEAKLVEAKLVEAKLQLNNSEGKRASLKRELQITKAREIVQKTEVDNLSLELASAYKQISTLTTENDSTQLKLADLQAELDMKDSKLNTIAVENELNKKVVEEARGISEELTKRLENKEAAYQDAQKKLGLAIEDYENARTMLRKTELRYCKTMELLNGSEIERNRLNMDLRNIEDELDETKQKLTEVEIQHNNMVKALQEEEEKYEVTKDNLRELETEHRGTKSEITELRVKYTRTNKALKELKLKHMYTLIQLKKFKQAGSDAVKKSKEGKLEHSCTEQNLEKYEDYYVPTSEGCSEKNSDHTSLSMQVNVSDSNSVKSEPSEISTGYKEEQIDFKLDEGGCLKVMENSSVTEAKDTANMSISSAVIEYVSGENERKGTLQHYLKENNLRHLMSEKSLVTKPSKERVEDWFETNSAMDKFEFECCEILKHGKQREIESFSAINDDNDRKLKSAWAQQQLCSIMKKLEHLTDGNTAKNLELQEMGVKHWHMRQSLHEMKSEYHAKIDKLDKVKSGSNDRVDQIKKFEEENAYKDNGISEKRVQNKKGEDASRKKMAADLDAHLCYHIDTQLRGAAKLLPDIIEDTATVKCSTAEATGDNDGKCQSRDTPQDLNPKEQELTFGDGAGTNYETKQQLARANMKLSVDGDFSRPVLAYYTSLHFELTDVVAMLRDGEGVITELISEMELLVAKQDRSENVAVMLRGLLDQTDSRLADMLTDVTLLVKFVCCYHDVKMVDVADPSTTEDLMVVGARHSVRGTKTVGADDVTGSEIPCPEVVPETSPRYQQETTPGSSGSPDVLAEASPQDIAGAESNTRSHFRGVDVTSQLRSVQDRLRTLDSLLRITNQYVAPTPSPSLDDYRNKLLEERRHLQQEVLVLEAEMDHRNTL